MVSLPLLEAKITRHSLPLVSERDGEELKVPGGQGMLKDHCQGFAPFGFAPLSREFIRPSSPGKYVMASSKL